MKPSCPRCNSQDGYYDFNIQRYSQYYSFDGEPTAAGELYHVKGGKRKYCANCNKDITKFVDSLEVKV